MKRTIFTLVAAMTIAGSIQLLAQDDLTERGSVVADGKSMPYVIRHLPVNAFPQLPLKVAEQLEERGCAIPQTYEGYQPENVVHGSFSGAGTNDWAVLCSVRGEVSFLIFFGDGSDEPMVLERTKETERLQRHPGKDWLGFNWGIDRATPAQVHDAQSGVAHRPPPPDHDAIADSVIERRTIYHLYLQGRWTLVETVN
jgi:hypothetical protein